MNQKLGFLCFQGIHNSLPSFWAKLGYSQIKIDLLSLHVLYSLQFKTGVHLLKVELTQLPSPQTSNIHQKITQIILITNLKEKCYFFGKKKSFWTVFVKNHHFWRRTKILTLIFFLKEKAKIIKKILYQRKVGILIVKVKKFGVVWYIPLEMTAKSARGGTVWYPPQP